MALSNDSVLDISKGLYTLPSQQAGGSEIIFLTLQSEKLRHGGGLQGQLAGRDGQRSQSKTPRAPTCPSWLTSPPAYVIWRNFPGLSPWTAISSPTHQRNVNHTACFVGHQESASSHLAWGSPPAKHTAGFQRSRGHSKVLISLSHLPKPSQVISTPPNYKLREGKGVGEILLATPAHSSRRQITPIPCWLPHLSPSSSPAKANFPLTSG